MSYVFTVNSASMEPIGYRMTHIPQLPAVPDHHRRGWSDGL
jgi:hypothetical protein